MTTVLYNPACFIGTIESIFIDAFGDHNTAANEVLSFYKTKADEAGNTSFDSSDEGLPKLKGDLLFSVVEQMEIGSEDDFSKLMLSPIDNENSFGILMAHGFRPGVGEHTRRLDSVVDEHTLILLDTTKPGGEVREYGKEELFGGSPRGFTFLRMEKIH